MFDNYIKKSIQWGGKTLTLETGKMAPEQVCDFGPGTLVSRQMKAGFVIAVADLPPQTLRRVADSTEITTR